MKNAIVRGPKGEQHIDVDALPIVISPGVYRVSCKSCGCKGTENLPATTTIPIVKLALAGKCMHCGEDASYVLPPPATATDIPKLASKAAYSAVKGIFDEQGRESALDCFDWISRNYKGCHVVHFVPAELADAFYAAFHGAVLAEIDRLMNSPRPAYPKQPA